MKKGVFIIPYFGEFNNYFQLFLDSCKKNTEFDWIIYTDDTRNFDYPGNVIVKYITFNKLKERIQSKFSFKISLERPYKLCDLRPMYGYIFSEDIKDYPLWGHCDTDLIFGRLSEYITIEDIEKYDKIGILGHCTLFRNDDEINLLFMKKINGINRYKKVLTEYWNHSFDEEFNDSINNIFEQENKKIRYKEYEANIYTKSSSFRLTYLDNDKHKYSVEKNKEAFFIWDNGALYRYYRKDGKIYKQEFMYIHMQSRRMKINLNQEERKKRFKIIPNVFECVEVYPVSAENFYCVRKKYFNLHYFKLRSKNLYNKIRKRITGNKI